MKKYLLLAAMVVMSGTITTASAQKKTLKIEDYLNRDIYPERMEALQWMPGARAFSFTESNNLLKQNTGRKEADTIITTGQLSGVLAEAGHDSIKRFPRIRWVNNTTFAFLHQQKIFSYDTDIHQVKVLNSFEEQAENSDIHEQTHHVAYTAGQNVFVAIEGEKIQVTNDTVEGVVNGVAVHRREFGISKGTFWSNSGRYLAYYHMDESMVSNYPLVDITRRVAEVENIRYPMAGMTSHQVKVAVFDTKTKTTVYVDNQGAKDYYLTNVTCGPDDEYIYIAELNRDQNHMQLNRFSVKDGSFVKTLFEEKNSRYVEPENGPYFLDNHKRFVWQSERDGFNHLYLYNVEGELLRQLTKGSWMVQGIIGNDEKSEHLYFYATKNSPLNRDIFRVNITNGKIKQVSTEEGTHQVKLSGDGKRLIDQYTAMEMGRNYTITDQDGKVLNTLLTDADPMKNYKLGEITTGTVNAEDGTDLYYRLIKPVDFDAEKKYPALIYVYGGPHAQLVTNSYHAGAGFFLNYMAAQGYVVFTLDNRGSANRGFEYESTIHRRVGELETADQMLGVEFLKNLSYVDTARIGVDGWSYGGFMTISMMLKHPGTFKAGCAGGPVTDWKYYEVMYGERYMDTPQQNKEGYEQASLLSKAGKLDGRLLIIHGTSDPVVVWQHSQQFLNACIEEGTLPDYFIYPGHEHNVRGKDRVHLFKKITQYFENFL